MSCPAVCSSSLVFVLGFFATGGGTLNSFFIACSGLAFVTAPSVFLASDLVSITTFLLLLEKIKLAVLVGDLRTSNPGGEWMPSRDDGPFRDRAAVLKRIASWRFIEGVIAGGDLVGGDVFGDGLLGGVG